MNKKEINEIKALFSSVDENGIERLCGCYVDSEKNIVSTFENTFLNIDRDEQFKYLEIFSKSFSGTQGKNLLDMKFTYETDGRKLLESMRKAQLKDSNLNRLFFDKVIETYDTLGAYLILLIYQAYDVPSVTEDGVENEDASEEVYSYVLCCLCPVQVTKPGLGYVEEINEFHNLKQDKIVKLADHAVLYPAFTGRSTDTDNILFYTQKGDRAEDKMLRDFLGVEAQMSAADQKETFQTLVKDTVGKDSEIEEVTAFHESLKEVVNEKKKYARPGTPVVIEKDDVSRAMKRSGMNEEKISRFEEKYDEEFYRDGYAAPLYAANAVPERSKLEVKTPDVVVKINYDRTSLVETRVIDGRKCLVIELGEGLVVNGIPVK